MSVNEIHRLHLQKNIKRRENRKGRNISLCFTNWINHVTKNERRKVIQIRDNKRTFTDWTNTKNIRKKEETQK